MKVTYLLDAVGATDGSMNAALVLLLPGIVTYAVAIGTLVRKMKT